MFGCAQDQAAFLQALTVRGFDQNQLAAVATARNCLTAMVPCRLETTGKGWTSSLHLASRSLIGCAE